MLTVKGMQQRVDAQQVTPTTVWQISPFHSLVSRSISATIAQPEFQPFIIPMCSRHEG
jgi:hypothetical protein